MAIKVDPNNPEFVALMAGCPNSWQGDAGFLNWCQKLFDAGAGSSAPAPVTPQISAIEPAEVTAGAAGVVLKVSGTGFGDGATVVLNSVDQATTGGLSAPVPDSDLAAAATLPVQVRAADGALSNTIDLVVA